VLLLPAEKDELTQGAAGAIDAAKYLAGRAVPAQAIVLPGLTHFQAYSYAGFEVGSNLAANWFLKYLGSATAIAPSPLSAGVTTRDITFFSEGITSHARLFLPSAFSPTGAAPAVVLAPDWGDTAASLESHGAEMAKRGLVAMAVDYRGWGRSGAFIYVADQIRWDDRLRFSQHTTKVRLRRKRLLPEAQLIDLRNAITYLQGEPGVDPARIGVWGAGTAGAHAVAIAATDARVKAAVAVKPVEAGKGVERRSFAPTAAQQATMVKLARTGHAPASEAAAATMNDEESRLALAEYLPFRLVDQIPKDTAVLFPTADVAGEAADFFVKTLPASSTARPGQ